MAIKKIEINNEIHEIHLPHSLTINGQEFYGQEDIEIETAGEAISQETIDQICV